MAVRADIGQFRFFHTILLNGVCSNYTKKRELKIIINIKYLFILIISKYVYICEFHGFKIRKLLQIFKIALHDFDIDIF